MFQTHGYLKLKLAPPTELFANADTFFNRSLSYKKGFEGEVNGKLAPHLGYRGTELRKELLVYRKSLVKKLPPELVCMETELERLGTLVLEIMKEILKTLGKDIGTLDQALDYVAPSKSELPFNSFIEVFRYDMTPGRFVSWGSLCGTKRNQVEPVELGTGNQVEQDKYRIACGEHRDTGLLTVIPFSTFPGLEVFNWSTGKWHMEETPGECIIFPGELFGWFTNTDIPALCHRVVLPLRPGECRYSVPMELLPNPFYRNERSETSIDEMSRLARGLVSTNN